MHNTTATAIEWLPRPVDIDASPVQSPDVHVSLLGGFSLTTNGRHVALSSGVQRLIAFLALQSQPLRRAHVAGRLWPDLNEVRATANLRSSLWRMRRTELSLVDVSPTHLALANGVGVDTREVVATSHRLIDGSGACDERDLDLDRLIGELLPDWYEEEWVVVERERMRQVCLHALEGVCDRLARLGRYGEAVEAGLSAVGVEPLRESAHRLLIQVHLAEGNQAEALRQYRWYAHLLDDELGLTPSQSMDAIMGCLLNAKGAGASAQTTAR